LSSISLPNPNQPLTVSTSNPLAEYQGTIDLSIVALQLILANLTKSKAPKEILDGIQGSIDALTAHWNDPLTKANFEARRG